MIVTYRNQIESVTEEKRAVFENCALGCQFQSTVKNYSLGFPFKQTIIYNT